MAHAKVLHAALGILSAYKLYVSDIGPHISQSNLKTLAVFIWAYWPSITGCLPQQKLVLIIGHKQPLQRAKCYKGTGTTIPQ